MTDSDNKHIGDVLSVATSNKLHMHEKLQKGLLEQSDLKCGLDIHR